MKRFGYVVVMAGLCSFSFLQIAAGQGSDRSRLKAGDVAPDFTLKSLDGESETTLSDFQKDKPVVLFFGSYT